MWFGNDGQSDGIRLRPRSVRRGAVFFVPAVALWWVLCGATAVAQQYPFRIYTTSDGLAQNIVFTLLQDRSGRLWVGTSDGLSCYDGVAFRTFRKEDGLADNRVSAIARESETVFWIGSRTGLTRIDFQADPPIFRTFTDRDGVPFQDVWTVLPLGAGDVLVGGRNGVVKYVAGRQKPFEPVPGLENRAVRCGLRDREGNCWLGGESALFKLDGSGKPTATYGQSDGLPSGLFRGLHQDSAGRIWIVGYGAGLSLFLGDGQPVKFQAFTTIDGLPSDICFTVVSDRLGAYWLGTDRGALKFVPEARSDGRTRLKVLETVNERNGLPHNTVFPIYIDREGTVWFGTHRGLCKLNSERFVNYGAADGLSAELIHWVETDRDGDVWVGTDKGLNLLSQGEIVDLSRLRPELADAVTCIKAGGDGIVWVGTDQGYLVGLRKRAAGPPEPVKTYYPIGRGRPGAISSLCLDDFGGLWIGTFQGLFRLNASGLSRYGVRDGLGNEEINDLGRAPDGRIWAGTNGGATEIILDAHGAPRFRTLTAKDGLPASVIGYAHTDGDGTVWFSTDGYGLIRWDGKTFRTFTTADKLSNNVVNHVFEEKPGKLWILTNKGVDVLENGVFRNHDADAGFSRKGTSGRRAAADPQGRVWFATQLGLTRYDPRLDVAVPTPPPLEVTALKINQTADGPMLRTMSAGQTPMLAYNRNTVEFEFVGVSFVVEERVLYQYKLDGFDKDWSPSGRSRTAKYQNLPPGAYAFQVRAFNAEGVSSEIKTLRFEVLPPWWMRAWFLVPAAGLAVASVYSVHRLRLKAVRERNVRLERLVADRTAEIVRQRDEIAGKNEELGRHAEAIEAKNRELDKKIEELVASNQRADRIFSVLAEALPGTVLDDKYRLEEKIGTGGFGAVYRAVHVVMNHPVAVKVFKPTPGNDSADALERFRREAVSACRINHPNAVSVLDSGISSEGIAYLVMELLDGHTLARELDRYRSLSLQRCAQILVPICKALTKAHMLGIIHRDIKPENIFLHRGGGEEVVKVVDFGIAKLMESNAADDSMQSLTITGRIIGTPIYMAPERFEGRPYDGRADVYSLGVMAYEMLTGRTPFQSDAGGFFGIIHSHLAAAPPSLRKFNPNIPESVEALIFWALAKDPEMRPTARELGEEFAAAASGPEMTISSGASFPAPGGDAREWESAPTIVGTINALRNDLYDNTLDERGSGDRST